MGKNPSHTVRNLHFLSENSTLIFRENCRFFGWKTRENTVVLDFLALDNFDFTRKIVKKKLGEKLVKMLGFCQSWILDSTPPKHWHYICLLFFRIKIVKRLGLKIAIHWKWGWSLGVKALISRTNKDDLPRLWPYGSDIKDQFQCIELTYRH